LSPDNRRLYLAHARNSRYGIQCIDLATGQQLWQTELQPDDGLTALAISPDGRVLASGSGFEDPTIHVWDAATGGLIRPLEGHSAFVTDLSFTRDGRRLISAATDQTIRFWDTSTWTESKVLRGHTDEVLAVAISEAVQLVASAGKDGDLKLWRDDGKTLTDGYRRLPENIGDYDVGLQDHSRVLLVTRSSPPAWTDLKRDSPPVSLPELGSSTNSWWDWYGTNTLCHWNGTNQIIVHEWRDAEFIPRGAITLASGMPPTGFTYNPKRQLMAWSEGTNSASIYLASLAAPGRRIELKSDATGFVPHRFSEDGTYLAAWIKGRPWPETHDTFRVWNVDAEQIVASIDEGVWWAIFAADKRALVASIIQSGDNHEIRFYDLIHTNQAPRRFPGKHFSFALAVSPEGGLVASGTGGGEVRFFDPIKGELVESVHGHLNAAAGIAFSPDGRRLISTSGGREAVKLWDVGTRQELLTLAGTGSYLGEARWTADGDVILAGAPWQAWRAPSWEEIAAAEAKEKTESKQP
jgi:WD40 repeat protein